MRGVHGLLDAPPRGELDRDGTTGVPLARLARAVSAAQVLSGALWEALCEQLEQAGPPGVSAERVSEVSERLADVAATVGLLAQRRLALIPPPQPTPPRSAQPTIPRVGEPADDGPLSRLALSPDGQPPWHVRPAAGQSASDRPLAEPPQSPLKPPQSPVEPPMGPVESPMGPVEMPMGPVESPMGPVEPPAFEIEDENRADRVHPALEHALAQLEADRLPCAVMLVELTPAAPEVDGPAGIAPSPLSGQIEGAFVRTLQDIAVGLDGQLMRERPGRYLLLLPETDRLRAQKLIGRLAGVARDAGAAADGAVARAGRYAQAGRDAQAIADGDSGAAGEEDVAVADRAQEAAVDVSDRAERYFAALSARTSARHAGRRASPLELAVGVAVCPHDGRRAGALLGHAFQDLSSRAHPVSVQAGTVA
jgi:hypothetical protein